MSAPAPAAVRFPALGTTAELLVTDPALLAGAERLLRERLAVVDAACSRFRADSEISRLHRRAGSAVAVSGALFAALEVALRAAERTDGLVDPTVGEAVKGMGYDRDFALVAPDDAAPAIAGGAAPGWWRVRLDPRTRQVVLPRGVSLDLGATAKALAADQAAGEIATATGCGVLVALGGDLAAAGSAPEGGWRVTVGDDHSRTDPAHDPLVAVGAGGLATSSVARRTWRRAGRTVHHIVDPRTGDIPAAVWRTVTVAAATCVAANTASTAAIVLGHDAPSWLARHRLPARLVPLSGPAVGVAGWPDGARGKGGAS